MITIKKDKLTIEVFPSREIMGRNAVVDVSAVIYDLLSKKEELNIIFAAAPSQDEFIRALIDDKTIDWTRINAFHMDEYVGLDEDAPQRFGNFLKERLFSKVPFRTINYINGNAPDYDVECKRYGGLLTRNKIDVVCMGIGENGHIAFNDPHVARFDDPAIMKIVDLDLQCRQQQVNDGCFSRLEDVPVQAFTLTIPTLMSAENIFCVVPAKTKANAVYATINGEITEDCPASILRKKEKAVLYLDKDSASLLEVRISKLINQLENIKR